MMVAGEILGQALTPSDHTLHLHAVLCVWEGALSLKNEREGEQQSQVVQISGYLGQKWALGAQG